MRSLGPKALKSKSLEPWGIFGEFLGSGRVLVSLGSPSFGAAGANLREDSESDPKVRPKLGLLLVLIQKYCNLLRPLVNILSYWLLMVILL